MARRKINKEFIDEFCSALAMGLTIKSSCDYCGISKQAYFNYVKQGEADSEAGKKSIYVDFVDRVKKAKAAFKLYHMKKIRDASESGSWQASAWTLERCYPEEYGRHDRINQTVSVISDEVRKEVDEIVERYVN